MCSTVRAYWACAGWANFSASLCAHLLNKHNRHSGPIIYSPNLPAGDPPSPPPPRPRQLSTSPDLPHAATGPALYICMSRYVPIILKLGGHIFMTIALPAPYATADHRPGRSPRLVCCMHAATGPARAARTSRPASARTCSTARGPAPPWPPALASV